MGMILLSLLFLGMPCSLYSKSFLESTHGDKKKLPKGCWSCHRGHGVYNTPMLSEEKAFFCFNCHGNDLTFEQTQRAGRLARDSRKINLSREFEKPYRHPIEKTRIYRWNKSQYEADASAPRYAECTDCHHHHFATAQNRLEGIKGITQNGTIVDTVQSEYELCFKCHAYSTNLPADQVNKAELFSVANPSYHPVVSQGKNNTVPSLILPYTESSIIKCTDCHNNDDAVGPKGPHASNYQHILKKNFTTSDSMESAFQYDLCYSCHMRSSVLGNISFRYHNLHIVTVGASCRTCHNPHGSRLYPHLIDFDNVNIAPSSSGRLIYKDLGERAGECFLNCHGKDHNPATYPLNTPANTTEGTSSSSLKRIRK